MRLNWMGYQYREHDGYGRYSNRLIAALGRLGMAATPFLPEHARMPGWLQQRAGLDWSRLTVACMPPFYLPPSLPGPTWLITMTEGSELPAGWADAIHAAGVERVFVPCAHNAATFRRGGMTVPVDVLPGGTDPDEFPLVGPRPTDRPYTFLALADRGERKGWAEVWSAFYEAFGTPEQTPDVRLVIKYRQTGNRLVELVAGAVNPDPRITFLFDEDADMPSLYSRVDCFAIPSRSEGWGMPHREAAMMGLPVITQRYSGMDDGHTEQWALTVEGGTLAPISTVHEHIAGEWLRADVEALSALMRRCYEWPTWAAAFGRQARGWLQAHQTWDHSAARLVAEMKEAGYAVDG